MGKLGRQCACPQRPVSCPFPQGVWVTVLWLPSSLNGFVLGWVRGKGVMLTWDRCVLPQEFIFPSYKGADFPHMVTQPQAAQYKPWIWQSNWARAVASCPLWYWNTCACPDTASQCFWGCGWWFREGRKATIVGEVQLNDSGANLCLIFSCSWNMLFITFGHAAGAVLGHLCTAPWNMLLPYLYYVIAFGQIKLGYTQHLIFYARNSSA